jgi:hypothetical protein
MLATAPDETAASGGVFAEMDFDETVYVERLSGR